ncbi:MAG: NAD(P)-dependent alcohol dehydrogenase [Myxococcota bacterium]
MRAIEIRDAFGLDHLTLTERADPSPGAGQIVVAMRAACLNFRDLLMVRGHYDPRQALPLIPCSDGAGVVEAIGAGVTRVGVGDRVMPIFAQDWLAGSPDWDVLRTTLGGPRDGTLVDKMLLDAHGVVKIPEHLTDVEAACLPCAGVTAWSALVSQGEVKAGDTVLVQGTGGVSLFALQFAKMLGARVIATSSSDAKLERVRALGADHTINYVDDPDWGRTTKALSSGGVDHVVEVGGAKTLSQSIKAARPGAVISMIGVLSGAREPLNITPILMRNLRLQGIFVGSRADFEDMCRAVEVHTMRPVLDETFELEAASDAFSRMASGAHFGKVTLTHGV